MTKPTKPTVPPAPSRSNPGPVFSQTADTFAAFQAPFADYLDALAGFVDDRADEALAAAIAGDLPSLTGQGGSFLRVKPDGTAAEFRTPAQVRSDLSINGIGSEIAPTITNLDTLTVAGEYFAASGATGSPNAEPIVVKHIAADATTRVVQEAIGLTSGRKWRRVDSGAGGSAWVEIPRAGSIAVADFAATAVRLSSEGFASPLDTELATALWVDGAIPNKLNAGGSAPLYAARAWVNFNGTTGAIRASGNIASVVRNGVGDYTINFTTAMPDANYAVAGFCNFGGSVAIAGLLSFGNTFAPAAGSVRVQTGNATGGTAQDPQHVHVAIFR
jgi:hypothetical protein